MNDEKDYTVLSPVSYSGNIVKEGDISLPRKVAERLLKLPEPPIADPDVEVVGAASTDAGGDTDSGSKTNPDAPVTLEHIVTAIGTLDPADESHWTKGNKPDATVLSEQLKHKVSAAERDDAWVIYQERQATTKE